MDKIKELVEKLAKFNTDESYADFCKAEVYLIQFREQLIENREARINTVQRHELRQAVNNKKVAIVIPDLFNCKNKPVKVLFLYNIHGAFKLKQPFSPT